MDKFIQPRNRKERTEDAVKEMIFLHESLLECHGAYVQFTFQSSKTNLDLWFDLIFDLTYILDKVELDVTAYSPDTFGYISQYFDSELGVMLNFNEAKGRSLDFKNAIKRIELLRTSLLKQEVDNEFENGATSLRGFMKANLTPDEITKAVELYKNRTYRDSSYNKIKLAH